jgi:hypothetical protein
VLAGPVLAGPVLAGPFVAVGLAAGPRCSPPAVGRLADSVSAACAAVS